MASVRILRIIPVDHRDRSPRSLLSHPQVATVKEVPTKPIEGQKTGTSGLRKRTKVFTSENYLANWVQSLFNALGAEVKGKTLGLGGDGRYYGKEAAQIIIKLAAGNGFKKIIVGKDAITATPAMSALIRRRKLYGESSPCCYAMQPGHLTISTMLDRSNIIYHLHAQFTLPPALILEGGLIMSASHNPGGPDNDFGIKFNYRHGDSI